MTVTIYKIMGKYESLPLCEGNHTKILAKKKYFCIYSFKLHNDPV